MTKLVQTRSLSLQRPSTDEDNNTVEAEEDTRPTNNVEESNPGLVANTPNIVGVSSHGSPTIVVTGGTDSDGANREKLTHFPTWGTPPARDKPTSAVRKVILSNLPIHSDLTLVQNLVHGGAIENYRLTTNAATGTTAQVTFTTGKACAAYYDKYPNGLTFKHQGKFYTAFVDKGKEVDVISGMMQGYLDCNATRVVQAVGADDDWSMRALHKVAKGNKSPGRVVEKITVSSQNDVSCFFIPPPSLFPY